MSKLSDIVVKLRALIADETGTTSRGRMALGVFPDQVQTATTGMTVMVCRVPMTGRDTGPVGGGTYFDDQYRIKLINPLRADGQTGDSAKLAKAKRKIEIAYTCRRVDYVAEESDVPEQCHIDVFCPSIECL